MNTMNCEQNCNLLDAKALGNWGEDIARQYIEQQGLKIVTTNYKTKVGEIDIIAKNGLTYHFIEIKARRGVTHGLPREAVSKRKQKHINHTNIVRCNILHFPKSLDYFFIAYCWIGRKYFK